jgi:hypothetical protein
MHFSGGGDILVATRSVMSAGIDLREVTELVLYDIPAAKLALQEVLSQFDRFGRRVQLNVYTLVSSNSTDGPTTSPVDCFANSSVFRT